MVFEIGQQVRIIGTYDQLNRYAAGRCFGMSGRIAAINSDDPDGVTHQVEFDNGKLPVWVQPQHLELIPDDGKQPVQYPLMRAMVGDKPLNTWQQVLYSKPLAASQPHLYLLGHYRSDIYDLEQFTKDNPRFILMSTIACSNAALGGSETQPYHIVFVIAEGE